MSLVQYVVVRGDLNWPVGALIAQGCHSCVSAIVSNLSDEKTREYINALDSMHKVVLKAENAEQLSELSKVLTENEIPFYCWTEQPENIKTCLATVPREKSVLSKYFKQFKLFQ
ncbi:putative peptidyl-tRNA hydrolase PTRHD1-like protein [Leptotrombidium deliense]|uniref:peptidyl-tRNA hydrolase n=1 Tax=Leptotrombidium deliense TaxID=299467 RepID=A0A443SNY1_9ACAR|nr:putative peptidyl-tRNA hydrolase PTRHD1-like protein [Leptotrombidium deliense]